MLGWLWSLQYPKRYREDFLYYWKQWRDTRRPEGGLWWACQVFGEYVYPGWTYTDEMREVLEQQRTEHQRKWRKELDTFGRNIGG